MNLLDLTGKDVGRLVILSHPEWTIVGMLEAYDIEHDVIYERDVSSPEPVRVVGQKTVGLRVGLWEASVDDPSQVTVTFPE